MNLFLQLCSGEVLLRGIADLKAGLFFLELPKIHRHVVRVNIPVTMPKVKATG